MVLKAVVDVHASAVVSVRCYITGGASGGVGGSGGGGMGGSSGGSSDPAAITADVEGVVSKMCFRRVMWTKWVVDTECLLDGEGIGTNEVLGRWCVMDLLGLIVWLLWPVLVLVLVCCGLMVFTPLFTTIAAG